MIRSLLLSSSSSILASPLLPRAHTPLLILTSSSLRSLSTSIPTYKPSFDNNSAMTLSNPHLPDIETLHAHACSTQNSFYIDPASGLTCLSEHAHLLRSKCCGNSCRHCPYGWENVRAMKRKLLVERHDVCVSNRGLGEGEFNVGRMEFVKSGDKAGCLDEMEKWKNRAVPDLVSVPQSPSQSEPVKTDLDGLNSSVPYTKGGDKGTSALPSGERLSKTSIAFTILGSVDEVCSFTGLAHSFVGERRKALRENESALSVVNDQTKIHDIYLQDIQTHLFEIMQRLFDVGGIVASRTYTPSSSSSVPKNDEAQYAFPEENTLELEAYINKYTLILPKLTNFILPTGSVLSSQLHVCRSVCRRSERDYIVYLEDLVAKTGDGKGPMQGDGISVYLNRLSDFYFTASRMVNLVERGVRKDGKGGEKRFVGSGKGGISRVVVDYEEEEDDEEE